MAEFMDKKIPRGAYDVEGTDGMAAMGKPIPLWRKSAALDHARQMGVKSTNQAMSLVEGMSNQLERDQPYEAMAEGMKHIDLTGTYRLMAVLLCEPKPRVRIPAR